MNAPAILNELGTVVDKTIIDVDPSEDETPGEMMARLGRTKNIIRTVLSETSTLQGLVDKPLVPGRTVILLNVANAGAETKDPSFAFGSGTANRRCAAEPVIIEFLQAVKDKLTEEKTKKQKQQENTPADETTGLLSQKWKMKKERNEEKNVKMKKKKYKMTTKKTTRRNFI